MPEKERGFSLIEVLIALSILMVGLIAIVGLQVAAIHYVGVARHRSEAIQIASQVMEYLKIVPADRVNMNPSTVFTDSEGNRFVDIDDSPLLYDGVVADGRVTWHRFGLMSSTGEIKRDLNQWNVGDSKFSYMVVYAVEWGGNNGSIFLPANVNQDLFKKPGLRRSLDLATSYLPEIIPGANQIYLEVRVGWLESADIKELRAEGFIAGSEPPIIECYKQVLSNAPKTGNLDFFPKRYISIKAIRDLSAD